MKSRFFKIFSTVFLICLFLVPALSFGYTFYRNLSQGSTGDDVFELQKILNSNKATQIADSGSGSPGNETNFFGSLTKNAVIAFQNLYKDDILIRAGLYYGNGFVGLLTREKLQALSVISNVGSALSSTNSTITSKTVEIVKTPSNFSGVMNGDAALGATHISNFVLVSNISNFVIKPGDRLTITGANFTATNTVNFGASSTVSNVISTTTKSLSVEVPAIGNGSYQIWVSNSKGTSQKKSPFSIRISDVTLVRPTLLSVTPSDAHTSDSIVVKGKGFDLQNNQVYSSLGIIKDVPSDGTTLTFKVSDLPQFDLVVKSGERRSVVSFTIGTHNGITDNYGFFNIVQ